MDFVLKSNWGNSKALKSFIEHVLWALLYEYIQKKMQGNN